MHHGTPAPLILNNIEKNLIVINPMDADTAISIIQRNERGRQGYERTKDIKRKIEAEVENE